MNNREPIDEEMRAAFDGFDDNAIAVPEGFAARLWSELESTSTTLTPVDRVVVDDDDPHEGVVLDLRPPLEVLVPGLQEPAVDENITSFQPDRGRGDAPRWFAAAAILIGLIGGGLWLSQMSRSSTVTADQPPDAQASTSVEQSEGTAPPLLDDEGPNPIIEPLGFAAPVALLEVTDDSVRLAFSPTTQTVFNATIRRGSDIIATTGGSTAAGETTEVEFDDLAGSTLYNVEITLLGAPSVSSPRLEFRSGGDTPVEISELRTELISQTAVEVRFATNVCALASFVVLDAADRAEVARHDANPDAACGTEHLVEPGTTTAPLEPGLRYVIIVEAEAVEDGELLGNLTTQSTTIETE